MRGLCRYPILLVVLIFLFVSEFACAQSATGNNARVFGLGQPQTVAHIPVGKLRDRLESLPPQARNKALRWLQDFSFPAADLDTIKIDDQGNVLYADSLLPDVEPQAAAGSEAAGVESAPAATLDDAFKLHSKPGSSNVVFIDFDGAIISGRAWNSSVSQFDAVPYNIEGSASTFSTMERTRIVDIWHRVAEDLAPYDIDVTTEEPATFNSQTGHILVTNTHDANGRVIYCTTCGGVAYVNVFGRSYPPYDYTYYSPALVFFNKLGNGNETYTAEASSHEFGHNLGLSHDGTKSGTTYYAGGGAGLVSWAPIMGNSYNKNVTEWSKGEYPDANQTQDDLYIIEYKLGYQPDDHGDTAAGASSLSVGPGGSVVSSNPELDPHNLLTENKGVIGSSVDVDVFWFEAGAGTVDLTITPAWDAFYSPSYRRGANLDIEAELRNLSGTTIVTVDPVDNTNATINIEVNPGTYYLFLTGVGNPVTPYTDYASLGQYFINGSVPPASVDETAPTPNPMTWAIVPAAISTSEISMRASTATDETSSVEYRFLCIAGDAACVDSAWNSGRNYTATGLTAGTSYTYQVVARDQSLNVTESSVSASATTDTPLEAPTSLSATGVSASEINLAWTDNTGTETGYRVERSLGGQDSFATIATLGVDAYSYGDSGLSAGTTYDYRVAAFNGSGDSAFATASGTTDAIPPGPASAPAPADGATDVDVNVDLGWNAGSQADSHNVYFGTNSTPPLVSANQTETFYDPGELADLTTYYWRIDEVNAAGTTTGPTWSFTTLDANPPDVITLIDAIYKADKDLFKVRATSSAQPDVSLEIVGFGVMTYKKGRYEYKLQPVGSTPIPSTVDIVSSLGTVLTVTVVGAPPPPPDPVPGQASAPNPANGQADVSTSALLEWAAGANTDTHVVYFGTSTNPPNAGSQSVTGFNPGTLANSTTYYWRIDEVNAYGTTAGAVWSFTTVAAPQPPGPAASPSPGHGATGVEINANLGWAAGSGADSHNVYFGTSSNPALVSANQAGTSYDPGAMADLTTYFWRIDEVNTQGTTQGATWSFTTRDGVPADKVVIKRAEWKASTDQLKVVATSTGSPGAVLSVEGFGQMTYLTNKNKYRLIVNSAGGDPGTVIVTSSLGGSATKSVRVR